MACRTKCICASRVFVASDYTGNLYDLLQEGTKLMHRFHQEARQKSIAVIRINMVFHTLIMHWNVSHVIRSIKKVLVLISNGKKVKR